MGYQRRVHGDLHFGHSEESFVDPPQPRQHQQTPCATTRRQQLWSLTMAPVWSSVDSPEMTLPAPSSLPSLAALAMSQSWSVWATRTPTSVTRPSPREVSSPRSTPSSTVSSLPGTTWRRSGITPSTTSSESLPTSLLIFTPRLPLTPRATERSSSRSSSRPSTLPPPTCASRLSSPCTPLVVPPVLFSTSEMVSPTPSPSMRVTLFPTPSCVSTWPDAT